MLSLEKVRDTLLARRDALMQRRAAILDEEQELLETREPDLPDRAADYTQARLLDSLSETERFELLRIDGALQRMERGTWGRCVVCGGPIAEKRLRAMPEADRCATCTNSH